MKKKVDNKFTTKYLCVFSKSIEAKNVFWTCPFGITGHTLSSFGMLRARAIESVRPLLPWDGGRNNFHTRRGLVEYYYYYRIVYVIAALCSKRYTNGFSFVIVRSRNDNSKSI